ncbi:hypothetical protein BD626DRAFT_573162 [Schizophyllum amplum]|uniref:Uncharacterized protein n=1 Tax=Schizophyllum amplum TaxID=97359 RepID=A0A550C288_9AGAR|nr:hypothetical protein BD626DRAFT_573162 [Auriculariopsis ampla]
MKYQAPFSRLFCDTDVLLLFLGRTIGRYQLYKKYLRMRSLPHPSTLQHVWSPIRCTRVILAPHRYEPLACLISSPERSTIIKLKLQVSTTSASIMQLFNILFPVILATVIVASPFDARDTDIDQDRTNCELGNIARGQMAGQCSPQAAQQCWSSSTNSDDICVYNSTSKRCRNADNMRAMGVACTLCQCYNRPK